MKFQKTVLLLIASAHLYSWATGPTFTYEAQLIKPDGSPVAGTAAQIKIQVRTPDAGSCLLYEETQTKNLSTTNGFFNYKVNDGTGTRIDSSGLSLEQVFSNLKPITVSPSDCVSGGGTYTPASEDGRIIKVTFKDETMGTWESFPNETIGHVPYSLQAMNVGGFPHTSLLRVENGGVPQSASALTPQNFNDLQDLISGTSTKYTTASSNGAAIPSFSTAPSSPVAGNIWYNSTTNTLNYYDGSANQTLAAGGGGLTSLNGQTSATQIFTTPGTSGTAPAWSSGSGSHTLNIPMANAVSVTAGMISKTEWDNFNSKLGPMLNSGQVYVGNISNLATPVTITGDANISNSGVLTIHPNFAFLPGQSGGQVFNGGTSFSENLTLDSTSNATKGDVLINPYDGNVAIGNTTPNTKLDVAGAITTRPYGSSAGNAGQIIFKELGMNGLNSVTLRAPDSLPVDYFLTLPVDDGSSGQVMMTDGNGVLSWSNLPSTSQVLAVAGSASTPSISYSGDSDTGFFNPSPNNLATTTGGVERMRVTDLGYVGIGTTTPTAMLQANAATTSTVPIIAKVLPGQFANMQEWQNSAGTVLSSVNSAGYHVISVPGTAATPALAIGTASNGIFVPSGNSLGLTTNGSERARIDASGNFGIGITTPAYKLDVFGDANLSTGSALRIAATSICTSSGCTAVSDERLKENISPLQHSLEKILQLQAVEYDWKDKQRYGDQHQIGFIAQELEKIFPEVVKTDNKSGLKSVAYDHLVAPVVEAIKALKDENTQLRQENAAIKSYLCAKDRTASFCH